MDLVMYIKFNNYGDIHFLKTTAKMPQKRSQSLNSQKFLGGMPPDPPRWPWAKAHGISMVTKISAPHFYCPFSTPELLWVIMGVSSEVYCIRRELRPV